MMKRILLLSLLLFAGCSFHRQSRQTHSDDYSRDTTRSSVTMSLTHGDTFGYDSLFSRMCEQAEIRFTRFVYDTTSRPDSLGRRPLLAKEQMTVTRKLKSETTNTRKQKKSEDSVMIRTDSMSMSERLETKSEEVKESESDSAAVAFVSGVLLLLLLLFLIKKII